MAGISGLWSQGNWLQSANGETGAQNQAWRCFFVLSNRRDALGRSIGSCWAFYDRSRIFSDDFPVRFEVRPAVLLEPEHGVPMAELAGRVGFYRAQRDAGKFNGFVRMSPNLFKKEEDGQLILYLMEQAKAVPVSRPVDAKKLARRPLFAVPNKSGKKSRAALVTVPEKEPAVQAELATETAPARIHTQIQYLLLKLGSDLGLDIWVARNDRSRSWDGMTLGSLDRMVDEIPTQFNEAVNRTIELIDVLWLKGNSIVAAFEIESTTSVYSGLLRMSDLLALQPNLEINLYLVAPDDRRDKVEQEILRPTFNLREKPLAVKCGFIPFSKLTETIDGVRKLGVASSLKPDFLQRIAEFFDSQDRQA